MSWHVGRGVGFGVNFGVGFGVGFGHLPHAFLQFNKTQTWLQYERRTPQKTNLFLHLVVAKIKEDLLDIYASDINRLQIKMQ